MKSRNISRYWNAQILRALTVVVALAALHLSTAPAVQAQTVTGIYGLPGYNFSGGGLVADSAGNLYGTTELGGIGACTANGCGTVFELTPTASGWSGSTIYNFTGGSDGGIPMTGLVFDAKGNLYGTTSTTVFQLSPASGGSWTEATLHTFTGKSDGSVPQGPLVLDAAGNVYGSASYGGSFAGTCATSGCGVVYKLSPNADGSWTQSVLHTFSGGSDGNNPVGALTPAGLAFYGATSRGGTVADCSGTGCGVVFKLSPNSTGWKETVLHSFTGGKDGSNPSAGLAMDSAGSLYGATANGGQSTNAPKQGPCGVAFKLSSGAGGWKETELHFFTCSGADGAFPVGPVTLDAAGDVFGESIDPSWCSSFVSTCGVVFKLSSANGGWHVNTLYRLGDSQPSGGLLLDAAGDIFGVANGPSETGNSGVFEITP